MPDTIATTTKTMRRNWTIRAPLRGDEGQAGAVDAIAQPCGRRTITEHMAEMTAAAEALDLGAAQALRAVALLADRANQRPDEARPAGAAVVLVGGGKHGKTAAAARVRATPLLAGELARIRLLGLLQAQRGVLLGRQ